jgi:hypothetical protein
VIELLAQIRGTHKGKPFTAGIVLWDDVVVEAAPIVGQMKRGRWSRDRVRAHCRREGWQIEIVRREHRPGVPPC